MATGHKTGHNTGHARGHLVGHSNYGVPLVTRDGPAGWYVPSTALDFAALGLAVPDYLWLCQEASGNLSSAIGSLTLTANATGHLYEQTVTGWTRKFLGTDAATAGQGWRTSNAALDLAAGESFAFVGLASFTAVAGFPRLMAISPTSNGLLVDSTGKLYTQHGGNSAIGTTSHAGIGTVHQVCWYRNATSNVSGAVTDLEAWAGTHDESVLSGVVRSLGTGNTSASPAARFGWFAMYKGANAERDWSAYLQTLRG